ncbi:hypothetical protein AXG93_4145s1120 [Marchantia polymorpha subsp. ruderalis]|uniref:Uncharacterized protein n=1 Tax=Marchantia polymorpha subsp. ruderalis TaxID=1480154 RepID=A0A176WMA6_MARPO|nr:hypothetical protein AXG93_4145s1120 [Marchantia polymorpha subsp. ruderalis]
MSKPAALPGHVGRVQGTGTRKAGQARQLGSALLVRMLGPCLEVEQFFGGIQVANSKEEKGFPGVDVGVLAGFRFWEPHWARGWLPP